MEKSKPKNKGGRPKGSYAKSTLLAMKMRELLTQKLHKRFGPIIDAQLDASEGIILEKQKGGKKIYADPGPDTHAFKNVLEQAIGKPKESIELTGKDSGPVLLRLLE